MRLIPSAVNNVFVFEMTQFKGVHIAQNFLTKNLKNGKVTQDLHLFSKIGFIGTDKLFVNAGVQDNINC